MRPWSVRMVLLGVVWLALGATPGTTAVVAAAITAADVSCPSRPGDICATGTETRTYPEAVREQAIESLPLLGLGMALLAVGVLLAVKITARTVRRQRPAPARDQRGRRSKLDLAWASWSVLNGAVVAVAFLATAWLATTEHVCNEEVPTGYCARWVAEQTAADRETAAVLGGTAAAIALLLSVDLLARRARSG